MQNTTINAVLKYIIIIGLAFIPFIPLYVANPFFFPFITGKAFAFRIISEIVFAVWLILLLREKGTSAAGTEKSVAPRINSITIIVTAFALITLVADLMGVNPLRSIWSNFERMEGWITIIHLWGYFMVLSSVLISKDNWNKFFNVTLIAGGFIAIYGLFQFWGVADTHQGATRVDASLGNSAYMAVYMLINVFLAGYMVFSSNYKTKRHLLAASLLILGFLLTYGLAMGGMLFFTSKLLLSISLLFLVGSIFLSPYSALAVFFSFILFQTSTRGTILGWLGAILLSCAIYAIFGRLKNGQSNISRMIAGGVIVLVMVVGILFNENKNAAWIQKNAVLGRLATIDIADVKTQARGYIWPMALKSVFSGPKTAIIGLGQENFNYIFNANYNPKMWAQEQWFDRAHSVFIDWLVASGLLGLGLYLTLYLVSLIYIYKSDLSLEQKSMLIGLIAGYAVHNIFVFDNQTSYVMFFTVLAFIHSLKGGKVYNWLGGTVDSTKKNVSENYVTVMNYIFVPVVVVACVVCLYTINIRPIQANTRLITALQACSDIKNVSAQLFEKALGLDQTVANQEIREQLYTCASNTIRGNISVQTKTDFYNLVKSETDKQISSSPNDARAYIIAGGFFDSINDWDTARPLLEKAVELSPTKQTIIFELAGNYLNSKKAKDAVDLMEKAYLSSTDNPTAKIGYVVALISSNQEKKALELFGDNKDLFIDPRIIAAYSSIKEYSKVIDGYKELIKRSPDDRQLYSALASAYYDDKQTYMAIQTLKTISDKFPELKTQVDPVIKQLESGKPLQ